MKAEKHLLKNILNTTDNQIALELIKDYRNKIEFAQQQKPEGEVEDWTKRLHNSKVDYVELSAKELFELEQELGRTYDVFAFAELYHNYKQTQPQELREAADYDLEDFIEYLRESEKTTPSTITYPNDMIIADYYGWWKSKKQLK